MNICNLSFLRGAPLLFGRYQKEKFYKKKIIRTVKKTKPRYYIIKELQNAKLYGGIK